MKNLLEEYILDHIDKEDEQLSKLYRDTQVKLLSPHMMAGHLQGKILKMLVKISKTKSVLEIGTYTGYSTLCLAEALPKNGKIHTIEKNDEIEEFIKNQFEISQYKNKIQLHIGNALNIIPLINEHFDMAFIDADKNLYSEYYDLIFNKIKKRGIIIADNTLWYGKVLKKNHHNDKQTMGILSFNKKIKFDTRVEKVIIPIRDGLTIIYKK